MIEIPSITSPVLYLIGGGGTGGFTFNNLVRLLAGTKIPIHLYDGDQVEVKNLKRQPFHKESVGQNKAKALVKAAQETVLDAPPLIAHPQYVVDEMELMGDILMSLSDHNFPIIISAVDNVSTRKLLNRMFVKWPMPYLVIDSGNHDQGGQVVWTTNLSVKWKKTPFDKGKPIILKNMLETYPQLNKKEDHNPGINPSCEEVVDSEPQAMMANSRNGDIIANLIMHVIHHKPLAGNVFESNLEDFKTHVSLSYRT